MEVCMIPLTLLVVSLVGFGGNLDGVVLGFTAPWCGPCQQMSPIVSRLERQGYPIRKVDVDRERDLVRQYNVDRMPTFILVIDGVEQKRVHGAISENDLKALCGRIPRPPHDTQDNSLHNPEKVAISRGKVDDKGPIRTPVQGDPLAASVRIRVQDAQGED